MRIEDRLRASFAERTSDIRPSEEAWSSIQHRISGAPRSRSISNILVLSVSLALFAGALGLLWAAFRPNGDPLKPGDATPPASLEPFVTATIPVGPFPSAVVAGMTDIWVGAPSVDGSCSGSVSRIDPQTNQVTASIPIDASPEDLAVGSGSVWVAGTVCPENGGAVDGVVLRIAPTRAEVVATIPVGGYAFGVAADDTAVWVVRDIAAQGTSSEVIRIDPQTNSIIARVSVEGRLRDVVLGEGAIWALNTDYTAGSVVRIDPASNRVTATVPLGESPSGIAVGEDAVWASGNDFTVVKIDPQTNQITAQTSSPVGIVLGAGGGGVWVTGFGPAATEPRISRLDAQTLTIDASVTLGSEPVDWSLSSTTTTVWVANYRDSVTRIDLR